MFFHRKRSHLRRKESENGKPTYHRRYLLITLAHAEKRGFGQGEEASLLVKLLLLPRKCIRKRAMIFHYHIGVMNSDASRWTFRKKIRAIFPEWEGMQIDITPHKAWGSLCTYLCKEDKEPMLWGIRMEDVNKAIQNYSQRKGQSNGNASERKTEILERLKTKENWFPIYEDEVLARACLTSYGNLRSMQTSWYYGTRRKDRSLPQRKGPAGRV